jgi:hypothetical protein
MEQLASADIYVIADLGGFPLAALQYAEVETDML